MPFKILAFMLRFPAMFIIVVYSAGIISYLIITNAPFTNLDEFLKNEEYAIAKSPESVSEFYLEVSSYVRILG